MSTYRLDALLAPRSIAVVGASPRERSLGRIALRNLRAGGFAGPIYLVNPRHAEIDGVRPTRSIATFFRLNSFAFMRAASTAFKV